jgi:hypothetical protein
MPDVGLASSSKEILKGRFSQGKIAEDNLQGTKT